jgi:hypothetical protein
MYRNKKEHFGLGFAQTSVLEAIKGQIPAQQGFVKKRFTFAVGRIRTYAPRGNLISIYFSIAYVYD